MVANTDQQKQPTCMCLFMGCDLHTHLMRPSLHGKEINLCAPDIGSIVPAGTHVRVLMLLLLKCNPSDEELPVLQTL